MWSGRRVVLALAVGLSLRAAPAAGETDDQGRTVHTVYAGQTVGKIAKRYNVTVKALRAANGLRARSAIHPGQKLVIPDGKEPDARDAHRGHGDRWQDYASRPKHPGQVVLFSPTKRFRGPVYARTGKMLPKAHDGILHLFASWRTGAEHEIEPRLIKLVVKMSDTFGGRPIRVVSGYREHSFAAESKHKVGRAFDFSIPGIPNGVLRDYLRTLPRVGVGYYPNSTHVHLDVREASAYWVDDAGPGEPPNYRGRAKPDEEPGEAGEVPQDISDPPAPDDGAEPEAKADPASQTRVQ
ncbi:MAG TPA: DUF882 domain-containing protein [Polyangiaceae bacterium]|nr:DUF882 domain-containing protein [Polyangiaceae bacterium]